MSVIEHVDRRQRQEQERQAMECRADRHWWQLQESAPADWKPTPMFLGAKNVIHHECQRCGTWRHMAFNHLGTEPTTRYDWPDWFRRPGEGRVSGAELRLWNLKQAKSKRRKKAAS